MTIQNDDPQSKPKEKSPAFQFYPKDFLTDDKVIAMSCEERGAYITLLCSDWLNDGICEADFGAITGLNRFRHNGGTSAYDSIMARLSRCFVKHPSKDGYVTNPRLQKEREKQAANRAERSKAGSIGAKARWDAQLRECDSHNSANSKPIAKNGLSSSTSSSTPVVDTPAPKKEKFLEKVYLTREESTRLRNELGDALFWKVVQRLEDHIIEKNYKSKDHNRAIRKWVILAVRESEIKAKELDQRQARLNGNHQNQSTTTPLAQSKVRGTEVYNPIFEPEPSPEVKAKLIQSLREAVK